MITCHIPLYRDDWSSSLLIMVYSSF